MKDLLNKKIPLPSSLGACMVMVVLVIADDAAIEVVEGRLTPLKIKIRT
jgi:hypothetical protein